MATSESKRRLTLFPFLLLIFAGFCLYTGPAGEAQAGYRIDSAWDQDSSIVTWNISIESGTPTPFRDFHIKLKNDADGNHFEKLQAPTGWKMRIAIIPGDPKEYWLSFFGDSAVDGTEIRVRYTELGDASDSDWRLTSDGDIDPMTGVIQGEDDPPTLVPFRRGVNRTAKVAVHVLPHNDTMTCVRHFPSLEGCQDIITTSSEHDVDFFPVFYDLVEYTSVEYSVTWPGTYSCVFTSCTESTVGTIRWPAGHGDPEQWEDSIWSVWIECQQGPVAIPGWGWLYEPNPSMICIVPHRISGAITLVDCNAGPNWLQCNFCAGFAGAAGDAPCGASRTEDKTWSEIKAMFD